MQKFESAKAIIKRLNENNYEAFFVGGCVRDTLLNIEPNDYDITTNAVPDVVQTIFENTIPTGKDYGTISVIVDDEPYEVTTYRLETEYVDNRRPKTVKFALELKDDLMRRDFTMNSLAMDINGTIIDHFGGQYDLFNGLIKSIGKPEERFKEDNLRKLRAIRFAAQKNFVIEQVTFNTI